MGLDIKREKRSSRKLGIHLYRSNIEKNEKKMRVTRECIQRDKDPPCGGQRETKKRAESHLTEGK